MISLTNPTKGADDNRRSGYEDSINSSTYEVGAGGRVSPPSDHNYFQPASAAAGSVLDDHQYRTHPHYDDDDNGSTSQYHYHQHPHQQQHNTSAGHYQNPGAQHNAGGNRRSSNQQVNSSSVQRHNNSSNINTSTSHHGSATAAVHSGGGNPENATSVYVKIPLQEPGTNSESPSAAGGKTRLATSDNSTTAVPDKYTAVEVGVVIMVYATVSLSIVYFNWWLFTDGFKYPVFVSWFQQLIGAGMYCVFAGVGRLLPGMSNFPCFKPNMRTAIKILPLAISFVLMVTFANICLKYVHVSTYQVARSLTIIMTIILSYGILGQTESRSIVGSCVIMVLGFIVGSLDPSTLSLSGVITGACSSISQAFYNVTIKKSLGYVDNNTNVMLLYNQIISSLLFIPVIYLSGEVPGVRENLPLQTSDPNFVQVWSSLVFSGFLAAVMNVAAYLCVKMTSPLTFNIVGVTKSLVQSLGGFVFLGDAVTVQALSGIMLSLCGSAYYSFVKTMEKELAKRSVAKSENATNVMLQGTQEMSANTSSTDISENDDEENRVLLNVANVVDESASTATPKIKSHMTHSSANHHQNTQRSRHVLVSTGEKEV
eukprot:Lankesteria_metandrocarpae@DN3921_c0_g1_i1.p1